MPPLLQRPAFLTYAPPASIAVLAFTAVLYALDPAGSAPNAHQGPGLTVDESFNVQQGVRLAKGMPAWLLGGLTTRELWGDTNDLGPAAPFGYHLADHPPLGRLWIGLVHEVVAAVRPPTDHPTPFVTACARVAPATAFALTVFLVGAMTGRWYGPVAGITAATAVVLMPRLFGHAHLASLETFIGLTYAAAVLAVAEWWLRAPVEPPAQKPPSKTGKRAPPQQGETERSPQWRYLPAEPTPPPGSKIATLTGLVLGLALLTKIQAVLLPLPIAVWAVLQWRRQAVRPLVVWGLVGLAVFVAGWPWVWLDPWTHLTEYFARTTERIALHTFYFGERYADNAVPWHYSFVMFLVTVPLGLQILGFIGLFVGRPTAWREPTAQLVLACLLFPLLVFALPKVAVYDGARLFLVVFPLWAVLIGRGAQLAYNRFAARGRPKRAVAGLGLLLAAQAYGIVAYCPLQLSHYSLLVGGLKGGDRLGLEPTYWGDSITRDLLEAAVREVPQGAVIHVAPVLHQFQLPEMLAQSPILRRHQVELRPFETTNTGEPQYVLFFRRRADLPAALQPLPSNARLLASERREDVLLAGLLLLDKRPTSQQRATNN